MVFQNWSRTRVLDKFSTSISAETEMSREKKKLDSTYSTYFHTRNNILPFSLSLSLSLDYSLLSSSELTKYTRRIFKLDFPRNEATYEKNFTSRSQLIFIRRTTHTVVLLRHTRGTRMFFYRNPCPWGPAVGGKGNSNALSRWKPGGPTRDSEFPRIRRDAGNEKNFTWPRVFFLVLFSFAEADRAKMRSYIFNICSTSLFSALGSGNIPVFFSHFAFFHCCTRA